MRSNFCLLILSSLILVPKSLFAQGLPKSDFRKFNPFAQVYTIEVRAPLLEGLQEIRNCIQYEVCSTPHSQYEFSVNEVKLQIRTELTPIEYQKILMNCPLRLYSGFVRFSDPRGNNLIPFQPFNGSAFAYRDRRQPLRLSETANALLKKNYSDMNQLLKAGKSDALLDQIVKLTGLQTHGYRLGIDENEQLKGAITFAESRQVKFGRSMFKDTHLCDVIRVVRHELEHIHQNQFHQACHRSGSVAQLENHDEREMSAHLNDILNLDSYCEDSVWVRSSKAEFRERALKYAKRIQKQQAANPFR